MMNIKRMPSCIAVVVAALLLAVSCGNMLEAPKAEGVEGGMGRLSVSMGDGRAVFPEELKFEEDKELTFTLSGSLSGGEGKEIRSWTAGGDKTAYQVMAADTSLTVEAGQWSFTLQAKRGGTVVATASKDLEVRGGTTNKLSFGTMAYSDEGTGTVTVTISWNEVERVTSVVAGLYNASDDTMVSGTEVTFGTIEGAQVTYTKSGVPAGIYRLKAQMNQDDAVIGTYSELVRVAGGLSSEAERELGSLNTLYTVTLDFGEEDSLSTGSSFPETYNRSQTVTLPTAEQVDSTTGAEFLYWYEEGDTEKKAVTEISGLDGDKTYCAYWQVAPVTFTPAGGTTLYYGDIVTLATATAGATIQYHLGDGSWKDYDAGGKIQVTGDTTITTITARATKDELKPSAVTSATYTVRKLEGITVTSPARTVYSVGQSFDPTGMVVTATYDDEEERTVTGTITTDTSTLTESAEIGKTVTVSYMEGDTTKEATFTVDVVNVGEPTKLTSYSSPNNTGSEWTYVAFGEWPQSEALGVSPTLVDPQPENLFKGKYYFDANGEYVKEGDKYYKVEPIVWRVLTTSYEAPEGGTVGEILLLAERILTGGIPYYVDINTRTITGAGTKEGEPNTVYPNNWQYSTIRAWLNGRYESDDPQAKEYAGKGFLQTAFTESAQKLIADTTVDNTAASTTDAGSNLTQATAYACANTTDKVFLLSEEEATTGAYLKEKDITAEDYGFAAYDAYGKGSTRIRVTTDYAKATGASQSSTLGYGGWWWLRSPSYDRENLARHIYNDGNAHYNVNVRRTDGGVVPALSISLGGN